MINIATKSESQGEINTSLFENDYEQRLYEKYVSLQEQLSERVTEETYFELLVSLKQNINQYFDHTMIMADDVAIKQNRLHSNGSAFEI